MPNRSSAWVGNGSKSRKRRGGLSAAVSILGLCVAFAVTGCGSVGGTGAPVAAEQQATTQSIPTPEVSAFDSPSAVEVTTAPATSAAPTSAVPKPPAPSTHSAVPAPARTTAAAKPSLCGAPQNPFGYNFCGRGGYIHSPAGTVCSYFHCIASFGKGRGYMVECHDATYSMSGGISGACSDHHGVLQPVYSG
jgi:hypothetical protein